MLADNFFDVSAFNSQEGLLGKLSHNKADIIIFDYKLDDNEGDSAINKSYIKIKSGFKDIPVILLFSSDARDNVKKLFKETRPDAMIRRPFRLMELLDKINRLLYSGDLEDYSFAFLLQTFYDEKRTGVLHITVEGTKYFAYFIDGEIVFIEYAFKKDTLGMLLLKWEKITEEQYNNAVNDASKNSTRLGVSLIKLGYITLGELDKAIKTQIYEKIIDCFASDSGAFSFKFQDRFIDDIIIHKNETPRIILEGVKRHYNLERLQGSLDSVKGKKFKIRDSMLDSLNVFGFNNSELRIVSLLKSICLYDELMLEPGIDKLSLMQILFTLSTTRFLVVADKDGDIKE
jgi:hypothetical protein